jgi:hypothetical protein
MFASRCGIISRPGSEAAQSVPTLKGMPEQLGGAATAGNSPFSGNAAAVGGGVSVPAGTATPPTSGATVFSIGKSRKLAARGVYCPIPERDSREFRFSDFKSPTLRYHAKVPRVVRKAGTNSVRAGGQGVSDRLRFLSGEPLVSRQHQRQRARAFLPCVEALEDRTVPAAFRLGNALLVAGTNIIISDSGDNSAANTSAIFVFTTDGGMQSFAGDIAAIFIAGTSGRDQLIYFLGGHLETTIGGTTPQFTARASRDVFMNLTSATAKDTLILSLQGQQTFVGANYLFGILGGNKGNNLSVHGDNQTIDNASSLRLDLFGGSGGKDNITVNMSQLDVGPDFNPGFLGEAPLDSTHMKAAGPGSAAFQLNVNTGPFAPSSLGAGDTIVVNLDFYRFSQGQVTVNVSGGTQSTPDGSTSSNLVELLAVLPALTANDQMMETGGATPFNPGFQQSKPFLTLDGGTKDGPNTGIFTGPPLNPNVLVSDIQISRLVL